MSSSIPAFPLQWPEHRKRQAKRIKSKFKTTLSGALKNVNTSLRLFGDDTGIKITNVVISSNVTIGSQRPQDPGVAIWYEWDGATRCIPVDRYEKVEDNLQAVHHCIEADRTKHRHAGIEMIRADYVGRLALPHLDVSNWKHTLEYEKGGLDACRKNYHRLMQSGGHVDRGGSHERAVALNAAFAEATKYFNKKD